ncbi:MAG: hypothetical protein WCP28_04905 [Actinomycetes bacterium]
MSAIRTDVLPVGIQPVDGETRGSYIGRLAKANYMSAVSVSRTLRELTTTASADMCRIAPELMANVLATTRSWPEWDSMPWRWHCPHCRARTGAELRAWNEAEYTACTTCRQLLHPGAHDQYRASVPVSDAFLNMQEEVRTARRGNRSQWFFLKRLFETIRNGLEPNWPPVTSREDRQLRTVALHHLADGQPVREFGSHPSPSVTAAILWSAWQHTRSPMSYYDLMDPVRSPRTADPRHWCGCDARSPIEAGHEHFHWQDTAEGPRFLDMLQQIRATNGLSSRHVPAYFRAPHEPLVPDDGQQQRRTMAAFLLHASLRVLETDGRWRPHDTFLALDLMWSSEDEWITGATRHLPLLQCSVTMTNYLYWSLSEASTGAWRWSDPASELLKFARSLVHEGLIDYQYRREVMSRGDSDLWSGQSHSVPPPLRASQLRRFPLDAKDLERVNPHRAGQSNWERLAADWLRMLATGGFSREWPREIEQLDATLDGEARMRLHDIVDEILYGSEELLRSIGEAPAGSPTSSAERPPQRTFRAIG